MIDPLTPIKQCQFAAIDFESAGATRGATDQAVQIGMACWAPNSAQPGEICDLFVSFLKPKSAVAWNACRFLPTHASDLEKAPSLESLWPKIFATLGKSVAVGHHVGTEKKFLGIFPGHGFETWIDTLSLSRHCLQGAENYTLESVCSALSLNDEIQQLVPGKTWHDALFDATASLVVVRKLVTHFSLWDEPLAMLLI